MRNLTFDAPVEFLTCHSLTNDNYGTTGRRIVSFYERSLVLSGLGVSYIWMLHEDFASGVRHGESPLNKWYRTSCQSTNRRTFYPPAGFNSRGAGVPWVISGRHEARRLRLVDRIMGTCRRCRSGFPGTRSNANSIVADSKSYLSRIYPGPSFRQTTGGKEGFAITPGANAIRSKQSIK